MPLFANVSIHPLNPSKQCMQARALTKVEKKKIREEKIKSKEYNYYHCTRTKEKKQKKGSSAKKSNEQKKVHIQSCVSLVIGRRDRRSMQVVCQYVRQQLGCAGYYGNSHGHVRLKEGPKEARVNNQTKDIQENFD